MEQLLWNYTVCVSLCYFPDTFSPFNMAKREVYETSSPESGPRCSRFLARWDCKYTRSWLLTGFGLDGQSLGWEAGMKQPTESIVAKSGQFEVTN